MYKRVVVLRSLSLLTYSILYMFTCTIVSAIDALTIIRNISPCTCMFGNGGATKEKRRRCFDRVPLELIEWIIYSCPYDDDTIYTECSVVIIIYYYNLVHD